MKLWKASFVVAIIFLSFADVLRAQTTPASDYLSPFPAHHVIGNVYFVGTKGLGIFLVTTPQGNILINSGL